MIKQIWPRFLNTLRLSMASICIIDFVGIVAGVLAATRKNTKVDYADDGIDPARHFRPDFLDRPCY